MGYYWGKMPKQIKNITIHTKRETTFKMNYTVLSGILYSNIPRIRYGTRVSLANIKRWVKKDFKKSGYKIKEREYVLVSKYLQKVIKEDK